MDGKKSPPSLINTCLHMYAYTHTLTDTHAHILLTGWDFEGHSFSPNHRLPNLILFLSNAFFRLGSTPYLVKCIYISAKASNALKRMALKKCVTRISLERYIFRCIVFCCGALRDLQASGLFALSSGLGWLYFFISLLARRMEIFYSSVSMYRTMTRSTQNFLVHKMPKQAS